MSKEYGYIGKEVTQAFRDNKGIFTPQDIIELDQENKWTNFGQLELIETQTFSSSVSQIDFTSIKETEYNVHFLTHNNLYTPSGNYKVGYRFYESGVLETASVYHYAEQQNDSSGGNSEQKSTSEDYIRIQSTSSQNFRANGYTYFYNLGDSTKYSFATLHNSVQGNSLFYVGFGSAVLPQASTVDGIRIFKSSGDIDDFDVSLYGIKEYS